MFHYNSFPVVFLLCETPLVFVLVNRNDINEVNYPNKQSQTQSSNEIRQELKSRTHSQSNLKERKKPPVAPSYPDDHPIFQAHNPQGSSGLCCIRSRCCCRGFLNLHFTHKCNISEQKQTNLATIHTRLRSKQHASIIWKENLFLCVLLPIRV